MTHLACSECSLPRPRQARRQPGAPVPRYREAARSPKSPVPRAHRERCCGLARWWRMEGPFGLTLEFTCSRRRAKPAVGCQVQRRVRPSGPQGARRRPPGKRTAQDRIHGPAADVRPNGLHWGCWHETEATKLRWPRQTKKTTGPGPKTARRRAQQVSTLDAAPRARGGARCQARTASRAAVHGDGAWKGHSV